MQVSDLKLKSAFSQSKSLFRDNYCTLQNPSKICILLILLHGRR